MIFFTFFITFLSVQGTFCDISSKSDNALSGAALHDSSIHSRHRHNKPAQHITRDHPRSSGSRHKAKKNKASLNNNSTEANTNATVVGGTNTTSMIDSYNTSVASPVATGNETSTVVGNSTFNETVNATSGDADSSGSLDIRSTSLDFGLVEGNMKLNNIYFGFLPDGGDAGGQRQTMASINSAIGQKSAAYGWYAQATSGTPFDGSQLLAVMSDVKACNCVFQPAVMPVKGWQGLTSSDNSQAVAIANVMKQFTDQGIPVWLRFAHEMNYYQEDGTYDGTAADFKAGWAAVAAACKSIAPDVKMWWTPNVASASSYAEYAPDDMSTVDLVGIDYYPKSISTGTEFVDTMKAFHDQYAVDGRMFAIGETGLGYAGSEADRVSWFSQVTSGEQLSNYIAASWFNYQKGYDFELVSFATPSVTAAFKSFLSQ